MAIEMTWIFPLNMVTFHSYVKLPAGMSLLVLVKFHSKFKPSEILGSVERFMVNFWGWASPHIFAYELLPIGHGSGVQMHAQFLFDGGDHNPIVHCR